MKWLPGVLVLGGLIWVVATHRRPAPVIDDAIPAEFSPARFHGIRRADQVDRTLDVTIRTDDGHLVSGQLLQSGDSFYASTDGRSIGVRITNDYYFIDPGLDIGACTAYFSGGRASPSGSTFSVGVRASPARLLYGAVSPDLVLTQDWVGFGASIYPPTRLVGPDWHHLGVGAWYGIPTRGPDYGHPGWAVGLSFSIR